jgi:hypothetical protein
LRKKENWVNIIIYKRKRTKEDCFLVSPTHPFGWEGYIMSDHPLLKTKKGGPRGCQFMLGSVKREKEEIKIK